MVQLWSIKRRNRSLKKYHKSLGNFEEALFYEEAGNKYADSIEEFVQKYPHIKDL